MAWGKPNFTRLPVTIRRWKGFKRERIEIHRDQITVTEKGIFGEKKWTEPVSAYKSLLHRTDLQIRSESEFGFMGPDRVYLHTVYLLELIHPNHEKTLLIFRTPEEKVIRQMWKDAARALNLPALKYVPGDE